MISAADTNVLLDVLLEDPEFGDSSERLLTEAWRSGSVIISEPVYAELAARFSGSEDVDNFLRGAGVRLQAASGPALHRAGLAWRDYARRRPAGLVCPRCGAVQNLACPRCGNAIQHRQHIVADFIIGAHALVHAERLLTRDIGYYQTYFPDLTLA